MSSGKQTSGFVLCVRNDDHPASLEVRKVYPVVPHDDASADGVIRVIDESGDDYLYPEEYFVPIVLSSEAEAALAEMP